MESLMTPKEVATLLKLKDRTVTDRRVLERLGLRPVKIGHALHFRRKDVQRLIEASMTPARKGGR